MKQIDSILLTWFGTFSCSRSSRTFALSRRRSGPDIRQLISDCPSQDPPLQKTNEQKIWRHSDDEDESSHYISAVHIFRSPQEGKEGEKEGPLVKVARWQNLVPYPLSTMPQSKEKKGSNFAASCSRAIVLQARRAKHIGSKNLAIAIWQPWLPGCVI